MIWSWCCCVSGRVFSTGRAQTSLEEPSCWSGTTTATRLSSGSRCSASHKTKTVRVNTIHSESLMPVSECFPRVFASNSGCLVAQFTQNMAWWMFHPHRRRVWTRQCSFWMYLCSNHSCAQYKPALAPRSEACSCGVWEILDVTVECLHQTDFMSSVWLLFCLDSALSFQTLLQSVSCAWWMWFCTWELFIHLIMCSSERLKSCFWNSVFFSPRINI